MHCIASPVDIALLDCLNDCGVFFVGKRPAQGEAEACPEP